jgi:hypothetical protein
LLIHFDDTKYSNGERSVFTHEVLGNAGRLASYFHLHPMQMILKAVLVAVPTINRDLTPHVTKTEQDVILHCGCAVNVLLH